MKSNPSMKSNLADDGIGDEYEVVPLRLSWGGLSLSLFLLTLPAPYLLRLQPWRPAQLWMWPLVPVVTIGALSLLGLVCGLLGLRYSAGKGTAKMGLLLNGAVVGCILLVILGMFTIFYLR